MTRARPNPIDPTGPGLVTRRVRIREDDVVWLTSLLVGYDHLVSIHGDREEVLFLVTTESLAPELDSVLAALRTQIDFEVLP